jgi:hypothetical protein
VEQTPQSGSKEESMEQALQTGLDEEGWQRELLYELEAKAYPKVSEGGREGKK